jgi:hypothetical protein
MGKGLIGALLLTFAGAAAGQGYQAPRHSGAPSPLLASGTELDLHFRADAGTQIEQRRSASEELAEHRKLDKALKGLAPQRPGTIDAYVVSIALDSDAVFGREAREAASVLQRRYGAAGRTIVLAGSDGSAPSALPRGSPTTLAVALARVAEVMDTKEDVVVLYTTSHGGRFGLYYHDGDNGFGAVSPNRLADILDEVGIEKRLLILSACYSGAFVRRMGSQNTAIVTAAAGDRTSFGCTADNDWTFFGDALINRALRKPQSLASAYAEAALLVGGWEAEIGVPPSQPQLAVGAAAAGWLDVLEKRMPKLASQPVGRPANLPSARAAATR